MAGQSWQCCALSTLQEVWITNKEKKNHQAKNDTENKNIKIVFKTFEFIK